MGNREKNIYKLILQVKQTANSTSQTNSEMAMIFQFHLIKSIKCIKKVAAERAKTKPNKMVPDAGDAQSAAVSLIKMQILTVYLLIKT